MRISGLLGDLGVVMRKRKLFYAIFLMMPTSAVLIGQLATLVEASPEECRPKPDLSVQTGDGHWRYRIDRTSQRRCWFLSFGDSLVRHVSSSRRSESINRITDQDIEGQPKLAGKVVARPTPVQEPIVLSEKPNVVDLAATEVDSEASESLVPHKVALISFTQRSDGGQNSGRSTKVDLVFFCGVLATAFVFAGGVVRVINRFHRSTRMTSQTSVTLFKAKRLENTTSSSKETNLKYIRRHLQHSNIASPALWDTPSHQRQLL
jgi:hypothetical protein